MSGRPSPFPASWTGCIPEPSGSRAGSRPGILFYGFQSEPPGLGQISHPRRSRQDNDHGAASGSGRKRPDPVALPRFIFSLNYPETLYNPDQRAAPAAEVPSKDQDKPE
jgi:hypothetical protein